MRPALGSADLLPAAVRSPSARRTYFLWTHGKRPGHIVQRPRTRSASVAANRLAGRRVSRDRRGYGAAEPAGRAIYTGFAEVGRQERQDPAWASPALGQHERVYWNTFGSAYEAIQSERPDLIVANDLDTLPLAIRLGDLAGCRSFTMPTSMLRVNSTIRGDGALSARRTPLRLPEAMFHEPPR